MSYILDALKKAEKEYELPEVPGLETAHDLPAKKIRGRVAAASCGAVCLIAAAWLFFPSASGPVESTDPAYADPGGSPAIEAPEYMSENREPAVQSSGADVPENAAPDPRIPETANVPAAAARKTGQRIMAAKQEPEKFSTDVKTKSSVFPAIPDETGRKSKPDNNRSASDAAIPAAEGRESSKAEAVLPPLREIAASMNISVHIFSDNPDERMVFINRTQYREGADVGQGCVLESITPEGVVLRRGEETISFR